MFVMCVDTILHTDGFGPHQVSCGSNSLWGELRKGDSILSGTLCVTLPFLKRCLLPLPFLRRSPLI